MISAPRHPSLRRRTWLGAFLVYVFALLPMLGAAHHHEENAEHSACQLCLVHAQAYAAPVAPVAPAAAVLLLHLLPEAAPQALQAMPGVHAARGPPSA